MKLVKKHIDRLMTELSILKALEDVGFSSHGYETRSCVGSHTSDDSSEIVLTPPSSIGFSTGTLTPTSDSTGDSTITETEEEHPPPPTQTVLSLDCFEILSKTALSSSELSTALDTSELDEEPSGVYVRSTFTHIFERTTILIADVDLIPRLLEQAVQFIMFDLLLAAPTSKTSPVAVLVGLCFIDTIILVRRIRRAAGSRR